MTVVVVVVMVLLILIMLIIVTTYISVVVVVVVVDNTKWFDGDVTMTITHNLSALNAGRFIRRFLVTTRLY